MESGPSSLDRFLWERGAQLLGFNMNSRGAMIALGVNSVVQFMVGTTFLLVALFSGDPQVYHAFLGLGLGMMALGVGLGFGANAVWKRTKGGRSQARLSGEGQKLLIRMMHQIGWVQHANRTPHTWFGLSIFTPFRTASQVLDPKTSLILDQAAAHYNRIWGLLGVRGSNPPASLDRHRTSILAAADEAMVNLLNVCAVIESMPESAGGLDNQITSQVEQLGELAEEVNQLASSEPTFTEQMGAPSAVRTVLEQLKLESDARKELNQESDSERLLDS